MVWLGASNFPRRGEVEEELLEETVFSFVSKVFSRICSAEKAKVNEIELENLISLLMFLLGLVGFKKRASGNSSEVATRAIPAPSEIYSPSAPNRFAVDTGAFGGTTAMGFRCIFGRNGPIEENPPANDRIAPGQADNAY